MGKVIALPLSRKETRQPQGGGAEILFFTGVRYYRLSDEDFAKLSAPVSQRRAKVKTSVIKPATDKSGLAKTAAASRKRA